MSASDWFMQRLSDALGVPVDRPAVAESTAMGAAYLAGFHAASTRPPISSAILAIGLLLPRVGTRRPSGKLAGGATRSGGR